jgi:hypothetical protein
VEEEFELGLEEGLFLSSKEHSSSGCLPREDSDQTEFQRGAG